MTERPILFSAPMVRALLAGTKTQTRRVVKPRKDPDFGCQMAPGEIAGDENLERLSPYGKPGDRLWVRETWMPDPPIDDSWASTQWAGCRDGKIADVPERFRHPRFCNYAADWLHGPVSWTPSIHMPRWASRILLEITSVRVERLQDITRGDAMAEGCPFPNMANATSPRDWYAALWEEINGGGSWDANPWVWVLEFKKIKA